MTLNNMIDRIKVADIRTIIKVSIIIVTTLWVMRELFFWTELNEIKHLSSGITSEIKKEQGKIEKSFGEEYDKKIGQFQEDAADMEATVHKNIEGVHTKYNDFMKDFTAGAGKAERQMDHGVSSWDYQNIERGAYLYISHLQDERVKHPKDKKIIEKLAYFTPIYRNMAMEMMRLGIYSECQNKKILPECHGSSNDHWQSAWGVPQRRKNWETFWMVLKDRERKVFPHTKDYKDFTDDPKWREVWETPVCMDLPGGCDASNKPALPLDQVIEAKARMEAEKVKIESEKAAAEEEASGQ